MRSVQSYVNVLCASVSLVYSGAGLTFRLSCGCIVLPQQLKAFRYQLTVKDKSGGMIGPEIPDSELDDLQRLRRRACAVEYSKGGIPFVVVLRSYTQLTEYMEVSKRCKTVLTIIMNVGVGMSFANHSD
jgi:hypothetical protein